MRHVVSEGREVYSPLHVDCCKYESDICPQIVYPPALISVLICPNIRCIFIGRVSTHLSLFWCQTSGTAARSAALERGAPRSGHLPRSEPMHDIACNSPGFCADGYFLQQIGIDRAETDSGNEALDACSSSAFSCFAAFVYINSTNCQNWNARIVLCRA